MKRAKPRHVIEGMNNRNIRYALNNSVGRNYVYEVGRSGGARVYERDVKVTPEHGGKYYFGDSVAKIVKSGREYKLLPGDKNSRHAGNRFLDSFERTLEKRCREYNRHHKRKIA